MNANDFRNWLDSNRPALRAWGNHIVKRICELVEQEIGDTRYKTFFKVTGCRVKDTDSAVKKLALKGYEDPVNDMTDLVGARFVVLVRTDLAIVEQVINSCSEWVARRDRAFEREIAADPAVFDYQSIHYLLRCPDNRQIDGQQVVEGMTCEVQIRTLLQHAYAELVHDNIYKPAGSVPSTTRRLVAKCMALMESTDDMFCEALDDLMHVNTEREEWMEFLPGVYERATAKESVKCDDEDTLELLDTYRDLLHTANRREITEIFSDPLVARKVRARSKDGNLFSRPMCALVYWLATRHHTELIARWPFGSLEQDMHNVLADLGKAA